MLSTHAKDRRVGADADGQREKYSDGEAGGLCQSPKSELQVGKHGFEPWPLPDLAAPRLDECRIAERAKGRLARLKSGKILKAHELLGLFLDMLAHLFGELVVKLRSAEDAIEPVHRGRPPRNLLK